jgi:hypothetical protein
MSTDDTFPFDAVQRELDGAIQPLDAECNRQITVGNREVANVLATHGVDLSPETTPVLEGIMAQTNRRKAAARGSIYTRHRAALDRATVDQMRLAAQAAREFLAALDRYATFEANRARLERACGVEPRRSRVPEDLGRLVDYFKVALELASAPPPARPVPPPRTTLVDRVRQMIGA